MQLNGIIKEQTNIAIQIVDKVLFVFVFPFIEFENWIIEICNTKKSVDKIDCFIETKLGTNIQKKMTLEYSTRSDKFHPHNKMNRKFDTAEKIVPTDFRV